MDENKYLTIYNFLLGNNYKANCNSRSATRYIILAIIIATVSSCGVRYESVPYFQDLRDSAVVEENITNQKSLFIQNDDILAITVASLNADASAIFNVGNTSSAQNVGSASVNPVNTSNGFKVDKDGAIHLPLIGSVVVAGLTTSEARSLLQSKLTQFLKEPVVSLRLINFRISVLGDVATPGVYPVPNERISVTEALGLAGDLTITAKRDNILLIREYVGKRQYVRLDLRQKALFNSPYFYLQNNDVLYIQPSNAKYANVDSNYRNVSLILSALSVIALLISRL